MDEPRNYCPLCEPETDPFTELVQELRCSAHTPSMEGDKDKVAAKKLGNDKLTNSGIGEGETGRAYANFLNRKKED